jgi:hypothetical protein
VVTVALDDVVVDDDVDDAVVVATGVGVGVGVAVTTGDFVSSDDDPSPDNDNADNDVDNDDEDDDCDDDDDELLVVLEDDNASTDGVRTKGAGLTDTPALSVLKQCDNVSNSP